MHRRTRSGFSERGTGPLPHRYTLPRLWVPSDFRTEIARKYHHRSQADFALFQWLVISGMRDDDDKACAVVPKGLIRQLLGDVGVLKTLQEFGARTGIFQDITLASRWDHKATMVRPDLDQATNELIAEAAMSAKMDMHQKVDFVTGQDWSQYNEWKALSEQAEMMDAFSDPGHPAERIIKYLHGPRVRKALRSLLRKNRGLIIEAIGGLTGTTKSGLSKREMAERLYLSIQNSHLEYVTASRTDRIYAAGASLMQLPREVRAAGFTGCIGLDVKNCQLAIVAGLWNAPALQEFLKTGESVWAHLADALGVDLAEHKNEIKHMLYAIIYGAGLRRLRRESQLADVFIGLPMIKHLLEYRNAAKKKILADRCMTDAFEQQRWLSETGKQHEEEQVRSLLARQVQSYELKIMLAAFEEVSHDKDILMLAWLHDGIYLTTTHNKERKGRKILKIVRAVEAAAEQTGITLTVEQQTTRQHTT